jgi:hypothetical protein
MTIRLHAAEALQQTQACSAWTHHQLHSVTSAHPAVQPSPPPTTGRLQLDTTPTGVNCQDTSVGGWVPPQLALLHNVVYAATLQHTCNSAAAAACAANHHLKQALICGIATSMHRPAPARFAGTCPQSKQIAVNCLLT